MTKRQIWCAVGLLGVYTGYASGDVVIFKSGDKLTGKVQTLKDGKLTLTTANAADVVIDMSAVQSISTDAPVSVKLSDGTLTQRQLAAGPAGEVELVGGMLGSNTVQVSDLSAINIPSTVYTGEVKFGGLLLRGNTDSDSIDFGADFARVTDQDKLSFTGNYTFGQTRDNKTGTTTATADNWGIDAKYEYNFSKKWYGFAELPITHDRIAQLDLRVNPSVGVGYHWIQKPDLTFATEIGLAWVHEQYTNDTPTREYFAADAAYHLTKKFNDKVSLFHDFSIYPSVENGRNFVVDTDLGLHVTITKHFFTELKIALDYDNNPAFGSEKTDTRYELNVGYSL